MPESTKTFAAERAASFQAALDVLTGRGLPPWADLEQAIEYLGEELAALDADALVVAGTQDAAVIRSRAGEVGRALRLLYRI